MIRVPVLCLLLLVAFAAGLALLLLLDDDAETDPRPRPVAAADPEPELPLETGDVELDSSAILTDAYGEAEDEAAAAPESARAIARFVKVVDVRGQPVAGAYVRLVRVDQARQRRRLAFGRGSEPAPYRVLRTNKRGRAPLHPLPKREFRIEAATAEGFGATVFKLPKRSSEVVPPEVEVRLEAAPMIRVAVKQEDGSPASGIRVEVHPASRKKLKWYDRIALWTDDEGRAIGRLTIDDAWARGMPRILGSVHLASGQHVSTPPVAAINGSYDLDLTVPRVGSLRVNLELPDGSPYESAAVLLWWRASDPPKTRRVHWLKARDGAVLIGGAPCGERVVIVTRVANREASYAAVDVDPAGVSQDVVLRLGPRGSKLNVILTTVEGEVLPRREFRVEVRQSDDEAVAARMVELDPIWKQQRSRRTRTNREGGISLDVRAAVGGEIVVFTSHGKGSKRPASTAPPEAVIPFPAIDEGATHDAGLITLPWYRVLAAGHVLYADGAPVHGIRVGVVLEAPPTPQSKKKRPRPPVIGLATTDSEGAFTLLGESPGPGALRIGARNGEGKVPSFPISLGVRDLRLQFMRYGGIRGRVRLADRTLPLRVDVIAEREDLPEPKRVSVNRDGRGEVHARNLISGVYRIRVYAGGLEALDLHGVQVPEGKTVTPGPIADLILGQGFRSGLVIVRDRLGAPAPKARVSTREREVEKRARPQSVSTDQDGEATIAWRSGVPLDVYVRAKGWSRRFRNPAFPLHVTVGLNDPNPVSAKGDYKPYAPPLIVIFDGALPRYAAIRRYDIALEPVGGAPRKPKPGELRLERTRIRSRPDRAEYIDVYPGTYDARLELSLAPRKPGGRSRRARVALGRVTVRGTPRERINLRVDSAAINYAVETTN